MIIMRIIKELVQKVIVLLRLMVSQDSLKKYQKFFYTTNIFFNVCVLLFPFLAHGASGNSARNSDKNSNTSVALVSPMHYATPKGKVQMVPDFHMGKHDMGKSHQFSKISKWKY